MRLGHTSTMMPGSKLTPPAKHLTWLVMRDMSSHEATKVLSDFRLVVSLLEVGLVKEVSRGEEVLLSGAGDIVAVQLAGDDSIFTSGGQLRGGVRELVQLETSSYHFYFLIIQLRVPLPRVSIMPNGHVKIVHRDTLMFRFAKFHC